MSPAIMQLILTILGEAPQLFTDAEGVVTGIFHGEGGAQKISNVIANVSTLTQHAATAVASAAPILAAIQTPTPIPPPPPPPPPPPVF